MCFTKVKLFHNELIGKWAVAMHLPQMYAELVHVH